MAMAPSFVFMLIPSVENDLTTKDTKATKVMKRLFSYRCCQKEMVTPLVIYHNWY